MPILLALMRVAETRKQLNAAFSQLLPNMLGISLSVPEAAVAETWNKIKNFYVGDIEEININDPNSVQGLINVKYLILFFYAIEKWLLIFLDDWR